MIYAFLAQGFEEIEAITVIDVLRRAELDVVTVGVGDNLIRGSHGIIVAADTQDSMIELDDNVDMVFLPGGMPGTLNLEKSPYVQKALDYCVENDRYIAAICAAPSILGHRGDLKGKKACCYPGFEGQLEGAQVTEDTVTVDGKFITSRGPATTMAFGLKLAEMLTSEAKSRSLGASMICQ